jgi:hypothetical protein
LTADSDLGGCKRASFCPCGTKPLSKRFDETIDAIRTERAVGDKNAVGGSVETLCMDGSWHSERRVVARPKVRRTKSDPTATIQPVI